MGISSALREHFICNQFFTVSPFYTFSLVASLLNSPLSLHCSICFCQLSLTFCSSSLILAVDISDASYPIHPSFSSSICVPPSYLLCYNTFYRLDNQQVYLNLKEIQFYATCNVSYTCQLLSLFHSLQTMDTCI